MRKKVNRFVGVRLILIIAEKYEILVGESRPYALKMNTAFVSNVLRSNIILTNKPSTMKIRDLTNLYKH